MAWVSGGVQAGSLAEEGGVAPAATPAYSGPPRPPGIPEHYVFDEDTELWMPPSAVSKSQSQKPAKDALVVKKDLGGGAEITVFKSSAANPSPYTQGSSTDPICFEYTNSGTCSRLARGEICRYRHLEANHPDVIRDKVRQGKLPPSSLSLAGEQPSTLQAVLSNPLAALAPGALAAMAPFDDPGPTASLCFDFVNNGTCPRVAAGERCKYRHLPPHHPDVIADKIKQGKLNPLSAASLIASAGSPAALAQVLAAQQHAPLPQVNDPAAVAAAAAAIPDPGPGFQLCFDFVNRGACSRLQRGEICRYRHLPPSHPDVIADKIKQGKAPGVLLPASLSAGAALALPDSGGGKPVVVQTYAGADAAPKSRRKASSSRSSSSDAGARFRERDRERSHRYEWRGYDRGRRYDEYRRHDHYERRRHDDHYDRRRHDDYERRYERRRSPERRYDRYERRDRRSAERGDSRRSDKAEKGGEEEERAPSAQ
ncbi:hypothetical protein AB1Y20_007589 [Prymnesium parvum]|uniref:C3H1-type domain-containing protein n=1 Tax=Prymnesium parvum TaxID=97485 RepID=A0AB34IY11_PRYPA